MYERKIIICKECGESKPVHAHGQCYYCYRKNYKSPLIKCKECGKTKNHHSFGLCHNCYLKLHKYDCVKKYNIQKYHNIPLELWKKITKKCVVCGFDKIVDLHHLDRNRKNTCEPNLIGLCPNHHKMLHDM